ncbi:MAG: hypothetical protein WCE58_01885, partial [Gallionella sp.]
MIKSAASINRIAFAGLILAFALFPAVSSAEQTVEVAPFIGHIYGGSFEDADTLSTFEVQDAPSYGLM